MRIFAIAGEPSGDALGGALLAGLQSRLPDLAVDGIGGTAMAAHGLASRFDMDELTVMGLAEVLPRYRQLHRRLHETVAAVLAMRPDILLTIDSPDFTLRVARLVRARAPGIRAVHYVAPTVWAWRPGRARKMAGIVDQVLALLPFEPPYLEAVGVRCDFVGHPVVERPQPTAAAASAMRRAALRGAEGPLILVLPGSRRSEVDRLAPVFGRALSRLATLRPGLRAVVPAAAPVAERVSQAVSSWPVSAQVIDPMQDGEGARKAAAFAAADVALAASGTVALELAAADTPMVIGYDMAWVTMQIMRRLVRVDAVCLVNLVSETRAVPECLGAECRPDLLADALAATLADPAPQHAAMRTTMQRLGAGGPPPGERAAAAVIDGLNAGA